MSEKSIWIATVFATVLFAAFSWGMTALVASADGMPWYAP